MKYISHVFMDIVNSCDVLHLVTAMGRSVLSDILSSELQCGEKKGDFKAVGIHFLFWGRSVGACAPGSCRGIVAPTAREILLLGNIWITLCTRFPLIKPSSVTRPSLEEQSLLESNKNKQNNSPGLCESNLRGNRILIPGLRRPQGRMCARVCIRELHNETKY